MALTEHLSCLGLFGLTGTQAVRTVQQLLAELSLLPMTSGKGVRELHCPLHPPQVSCMRERPAVLMELTVLYLNLCLKNKFAKDFTLCLVVPKNSCVVVKNREFLTNSAITWCLLPTQIWILLVWG